MKAKDVLQNIPVECECEVKESGKGLGKVKGYACTKRCDYCKALAAESKIQSDKNKEQQDISHMIAEKANKLAKEKLIEEGIIEEVDGKLRKK